MERVVARTSTPSRSRFVDAMGRYTSSVVTEAKDRSDARVHSIHDYFCLRRETVGAEPSFCIIEFALDLPSFVFEHAVIKNLRALTVDMLIIANVSDCTGCPFMQSLNTSS